MPRSPNSPFRLIIIAISIALLAGCATTPQAPRRDDPYETFNRKVYAFNDFADRVAIRPVAAGYRKVTNDTTRRLVSNFFNNVEAPVSIINDLLQANPKYAFTTASRVVINTTVGILGLFDPASEMGIDAHDTDFGVTLAKWGFPEGPYLVIPLMGSTTGRDLIAFPVDNLAFDPLHWYSTSHDFKFNAQYLPTTVYLISLRSSAIDAEGLLEGVYDPYVFFRDAYRQRRLYRIYDGNPPIEAIQALQGVDDIDIDQLLKEQEKVEEKPQAPPKKN